MGRMVTWLQTHEQKIFHFFNQRIQNPFLDWFMNRVTHLGGATFTLGTAVLLILLGNEFWRPVGWQSLVSVTASHIPVALLKKIYPRLRPYLVLPNTNTCENPLIDHSFPSGHTTAIFALVLPIVSAVHLLGLILLPIAMLVAVSRIYLGLHYPSDVLGGMGIGTIASICCVSIMG